MIDEVVQEDVYTARALPYVESVGGSRVIGKSSARLTVGGQKNPSLGRNPSTSCEFLGVLSVALLPTLL